MGGVRHLLRMTQPGVTRGKKKDTTRDLLMGDGRGEAVSRNREET